MMQAILGNAIHPEYGVATIPFPIPRAEYANCVALLEALEPDNTPQITWLYLPAAEEQLHRDLRRSGIAEAADFCYRLEDSVFPAEVEAMLDIQHESIYELNRLAQAVDRLQWDQRMKLGAVAAMAEPVNVRQLRQLVENLDQFEFAPGIHSPEEYGRYLIRDSGYFSYDPDLEEFYDYEKCGLQQIAQEKGCFTEQGYLSCQGEQSLEELLWEADESQKPAEPEMQMGGWCSKQALMARIPTLR